MSLTKMQLEALDLEFSAQVAKARADLEVYLQHPVGIGEHSEVLDEMKAKIQKIADNQSYLDTLRSLQGIENEEVYEIVCEILSPNGELKKFSRQASGFDLEAFEACEIKPWTTEIIRTGVKLKIPFGLEGQVRPRSGLSTKGVIVTNSPGTIDSDYRGEIKVILTNLSDNVHRVEVGHRIAQLVFSKVVHPLITSGHVQEDTERGQGGFGSTGQ